MRKKATVMFSVGLLTLGSIAFATPAQAHDEGPPLHGHMLVLGLQFDGDEPVGFRKCVDLAAGQPLPNNAHHFHAHTGRAGEALRAAGHFVVPAFPLTPFKGCADLEAVFG